LPPQFGTESPTIDSYLARSRPDGWTGDGTRHDCYAERGRRSGQRYRGLVAFAGWREYRAGTNVSDSRPRASFGGSGGGSLTKACGQTADGAGSLLRAIGAGGIGAERG
jgi:hypothetical protein